MLQGFYFETESFGLNIMSYIFLMSVTYSYTTYIHTTYTVVETVVKGVMLLVFAAAAVLAPLLHIVHFCVAALTCYGQRNEKQEVLQRTHTAQIVHLGCVVLVYPRCFRLIMTLTSCGGGLVLLSFFLSLSPRCTLRNGYLALID